MSERQNRRRGMMDAILSGSPDPASPRTSVAMGARPAQGLMREMLESAEAELAELRQQKNGVQMLDPTRIRHSRFRDRLEQGFTDRAFEELKASISRPNEDGTPTGVTMPIKVRPITGDPDFDYEVVYGHRRHRATLELGMPVPAIVEALDDRQVLLVMRQENKERADLSAYEEALSLDRMITEGVFKDQSAMALAFGLSKGACSKFLALARLPEDVVAIFKDPRDISINLGHKLRAAMKDKPKVVSELKAMAKERPLSAAKVQAHLKGASQIEALEGRTKAGVQIKAFPSGSGMQLLIERQLTQQQLNHLAEALERL